MKVILLIFVSVFCFLLLNAANPDYDISKFRPVNLTDYNLVMGFGSNGGYSFPNKDYRQSSFNNGCGFSGNAVKESERYKVAFSTYFNPTYGVSNSHFDDMYDLDGELRTSTNLHFNNELTYRRFWNMFFAEAGIGEEYTNSIDKLKYTYPEEDFKQTIHEYRLSTDYSLSVGLGRLYECQEAYLAWYIYKELDKNACLKQQYNAQAIDSLANVLYKLRSVHIIDPFQKIRVKMTTLIDYLQASGYVDEEKESKATAILIQLWQVNGTQRLTGFELAITPASDIYNTNRTVNTNNDEDNPDNTSYSATHSLCLSFTFQKPIHTIFQLQSQAILTQYWLDYFRHSDYDSTDANWLPYTRFNASSSFSWYPDFQSSAKFLVTGVYLYRNLDYIGGTNGKNNDKLYYISHKDRSLTINTQLIYTRNLTNRTSCSASISGNYYWLRLKNQAHSQNKSVGCSLGFNYYLF
jgi:hypothetical protein